MKKNKRRIRADGGRTFEKILTLDLGSAGPMLSAGCSIEQFDNLISVGLPITSSKY